MVDIITRAHVMEVCGHTTCKKYYLFLRVLYVKFASGIVLFSFYPYLHRFVLAHCIFSTFQSHAKQIHTGILLGWASNPRPLRFQSSVFTNQTTKVARQLVTIFDSVGSEKNRWLTTRRFDQYALIVFRASISALS